MVAAKIKISKWLPKRRKRVKTPQTERIYLIFRKSSKHGKIYLTNVQSISISEIMKYPREVCGIPTNTMDAKAQHFRGCMVNNSFGEVKNTGNNHA